MSTEHLTDLPRVAAMMVLIAALFLLQRRNPRIAIGSWLLALGLIFSSQISWYFTWFGTPFYASVHTFRLCVDLLTGLVLLLFTGRPLRQVPQRMLFLLWNGAPLIALEILYGTEIFHPLPYLVCAAIGAIISVIVAAHLRRGWLIPIAQIIVWTVIAVFSARENYRACAYIGLAVTYAASALHIWFRLRKGSLGRIGITASLGIWSAVFLIHPWVLKMPRYRDLSNEIWNMQKFFLSIAMLIFLFEDEIRENAQLALHDQLTGLPNRRLMEQRLLTAIGNGRATVLLMDLDGFKEINDSLGHLAGDEILRQATARLTAILDENETLARLGGDEFLVVSTRDATELTASISSAFQKPVTIEDGTEIQLGASIGNSTFPADASHATGSDAIRLLLHAADHRMYTFKRDRDSAAQPRRPDRLLPD